MNGSSINEELKDCNNYLDARIKLSKIIENRQRTVIEDNKDKLETYYNMIREFKKNPNYSVRVITTNYTMFAKEMIGLEDEQIAYVHGKLDLFEDLRTKRISKITDFSENDFIFPFILVQSGVKPIINSFQIREFEKARKMILSSDELVTLGYGVNSDDEQISNLLRERLRLGKTVKCFIYQKDLEKIDNMEKVLYVEENHQISFEDASDFESFLKNIPN